MTRLMRKGEREMRREDEREKRRLWIFYSPTPLSPTHSFVFESANQKKVCEKNSIHMIFFRWFILRLFFSLLALPLAAFFMLWLLHEIIFPGDVFNDLPVVIVLWLILFWAMNFVLRRLAITRYDYLQKRAQLALDVNHPDDLEEIYNLTGKLFVSGLLPQSLTATLQRNSRRQFLSFYERNLNTPEAFDELRLALREGYRRDEIYTLLKNYLLSQPNLTTRFIDLAEELLDQKPDDAPLLEHLVRKFVDSRARHHRAVYFYRRHIEQEGKHTPAIVSLCLQNLLSKNRDDDFALWVYACAFEAGQSDNSTLRRLLFQAYQQQQAIGRKDRLAEIVAKIAGTFSPSEFAVPPPAFKKHPTLVNPETLKNLAKKFHAVREFIVESYIAVQPLVKEFYTRHRRYVLISAGAVALVLGLWIILADRPAKQPPPPVFEQAEDLSGYFALQVGAWKKSRSAAQEQEKLQRAGLRVRILQPRSSAGWYRIHVGKYATRRAAQAAADSLKMRGVIEDYFISEYQSR